MHGIEWIGWFSSVLLLATLGLQVRKQWRECSSHGVSRWLFLGQVGAESGFLLYSILLGSWVFSVTNGALLLVNLCGAVVTYRHKHRAQ